MTHSSRFTQESRPDRVADVLGIGLPLGLAGAALRLWADPIPLRERTAGDVVSVLLRHAFAGVAVVGVLYAFAATGEQPKRALPSATV
jgi:hypothetical protein